MLTAEYSLVAFQNAVYWLFNSQVTQPGLALVEEVDLEDIRYGNDKL